MTQLGIVAALNAEIRPLSKRTLRVGVVERRSDHVSLIVSGIGAACARAAGQTLIARGATALLSWGCAAALDTELKPGSLLLPKIVIAADGDGLPVSSVWHEHLHNLLAVQFPIYIGSLAESPVVLADSAAKRALFEQSGAGAADMESAALGRLALAAGVPFMVVRAISDSADTALPQKLINLFQQADPPHLARLLATLMLCPGEWLDIAKLAWGWRAAKARLSQVACHMGHRLYIEAR